MKHFQQTSIDFSFKMKCTCLVFYYQTRFFSCVFINALKTHAKRESGSYLGGNQTNPCVCELFFSYCVTELILPH